MRGRTNFRRLADDMAEKPLWTGAPKIIVGNWKMNGLADHLVELDALAQFLTPAGCRVAVCPPVTLLREASARLAGSGIEVGGQDCHAEEAGPYTGDVSARMLADAGARLVILGHSERRGAHLEDDLTVAAKVRAALGAGLEPIICVGETHSDRQAGRTLEVVCRQVEQSLPAGAQGRPFCVAYEPVWAIGAGVTPSADDIALVHLAIRRTLTARCGEAGDHPILYGGSVRPENADALLAIEHVGGLLVGGASLSAREFSLIARAAIASGLRNGPFPVRAACSPANRAPPLGL